MAPGSALVDLGGTQVRTGLWDDDLGLLGKRVEETDHSAGPESIVAQVTRMMAASLGSVPPSARSPERLVIASPGPLNPATGMVSRPPNMPGWGVVPLRALMEEAIGLPTTLVNDATAAGFGEYRYGAGRGCRNLVYFTISTGIGGGVVVEGEMLQGSTGAGAELGHMTIDRHGPRCPCGNVGCLEAFASGSSIARRFREALAAERASWPGPYPPTAADVARAAAEGHEPARSILEDAAEAIGHGVVTALHVFNPDVVVLGGGVTKAGELLFDPIRRTVDRFAIVESRQAARIVPAELGDDVGIMGAAAVAAHLARTRDRA